MKKYIDFDPNKNWPSEEGLFYECELCGEIIPSNPKEYTRCKCGNFSIDAEYGRMGAKDHSKIKLFKEVTT